MCENVLMTHRTERRTSLGCMLFWPLICLGLQLLRTGVVFSCFPGQAVLTLVNMALFTYAGEAGDKRLPLTSFKMQGICCSSGGGAIR